MLADGESTLYLGRLLNMQDVHDTEMKHRITRAWAKFSTFKNELTDKRYP